MARVISAELSAQTCLKNIREAYNKYLLSKPGNFETMLLCDGGSENNNTLVDEFTEQLQTACRAGIEHNQLQNCRKVLMSREFILQCLL